MHKLIPTKPIILPILKQPDKQQADAIRILRTNLISNMKQPQLKIIQITSPDQGVGKSTISVNLAISLAQSGKRTLLIDADLHRPSLQDVFSSAAVGLSDYFHSGELHLQSTSTFNLRILTAGSHNRRTADLLATETLHLLLKKIKADFDIIIVDSPALAQTADAQIIAAQVDATALVVQTGRTQKKALARAKTALNTVDAIILGVILT